MNYKEVNYQETIKGVKKWVNPKNRFNIFMLHYTADPDKDPDRQGKTWYDNEKLGTLKATWEKEYEIDFSTKSGKLIFGPEFCDFDKNIHLINSFELPEPYELLLSLDFGQRNPTCGLVGAFMPDNTLYIIDEYYQPGVPSVSSRNMFKKFGYLLTGDDMAEKTLSQKRMLADNFSIRVIDPSTTSKNRSKIVEGEEIPYSVIEEFYDHGWDFEPADNDVKAGITRIREYMQLDKDGKAKLYIFKDKCPYLSWEIQHYRYKELSEARERDSNDSEEPVKKDDHAVDSLKYMILTRPSCPKTAPKPLTRIQKDIEKLLKPKASLTEQWDIN